MTHNLSAFVSIKTVSLSAFSLKLQLLTDLDKLAFKMLKLARHGLDAGVAFSFAIDRVTLVTADDSELALLLVIVEVLLEHLSLAAVVVATKHGVQTLFHVPLDVCVVHDLSAAFLSILTA